LGRKDKEGWEAVQAFSPKESAAGILGKKGEVVADPVTCPTEKKE